MGQFEAGRVEAEESEYALAIVFTGHRVDEPGRAAERFPARAEGRVKDAIYEAVNGLRVGSTIGIAGGASGGDLLFHEVCAELGVPTVLRLALPVAEYVAASVAPAGEDWVRRFEAVVERLGDGVQVLEADEREDVAEVWAKANLWMLREAKRLGRERVLLALWDGKGGDGPGGTEHLVSVAPQYGVRVAPVLSMQQLVS